MNNITWKLAPNMFGKYEVSNTGLIRNIRIGKIRKTFDYKGYQAISYYNKGKFYLKRVHRIVAEAYIPNPKGKLEVNHIDGNKANNHINNLEWCTRKENQRHAIDTGLQIYKTGENSHAARLTLKQVHEIREKYIPKTYSQYRLAIEYGVSRSCIMHIISGDRWRDYE